MQCEAYLSSGHGKHCSGATMEGDAPVDAKEAALINL